MTRLLQFGSLVLLSTLFMLALAELNHLLSPFAMSLQLFPLLLLFPALAMPPLQAWLASLICIATASAFVPAHLFNAFCGGSLLLIALLALLRRRLSPNPVNQIRWIAPLSIVLWCAFLSFASLPHFQQSPALFSRILFDTSLSVLCASLIAPPAFNFLKCLLPALAD